AHVELVLLAGRNVGYLYLLALLVENAEMGAGRAGDIKGVRGEGGVGCEAGQQPGIYRHYGAKALSAIHIYLAQAVVVQAGCCGIGKLVGVRLAAGAGA
nr:hypothetical protein [Tanacetum cinerariifolium]